jgi:hypothetical protein
LLGGRQSVSGQLNAAIASEVCDVRGIILRETERPHLGGKPEPAKVFHGARLSRIRLWVDGGARLLIDQCSVDATTTELNR